MRDIFKKAGFLFIFVILIWLIGFFVTGTHYCSTTEVVDGKAIDAEKVQCHFNPPEKINLKIVLELTPIILVVGSIFPLAVIVLGLKDRLFEKKGMSQSEITRKGMIWFVSPFMILITILAIIFAWSISGLLEAYVFGLGIGSILGLCCLWILLKKRSGEDKKRIKLDQANYQKSIALAFAVLIILNLSGGNAMVYSFLDTHLYFTEIFMGMVLSFCLFAFITHLLMAIFKKRTVLGTKF